MSRIADLGPGFKNLPAVLGEYLDDIEQAKAILPIKGKTLDEAFKEQTGWPVFFYIKKAELKTLLQFMEMQVAKVRSMHTRRYADAPRDYGVQSIEKFINNEDDYIKMNQLKLEVEEVYEIFSGIMDSFDKRGFALRDLTSAKTGDFHRDLL